MKRNGMPSLRDGCAVFPEYAHPLRVLGEIEDLIDFYRKMRNEIFADFDSLLSRSRDPISNSFVMVEKHSSGGIYDSRPS